MPTIANIYFQAYHEGETLPVVLIHGAGGTLLSWPSEIRRLPGARIYALDLPGHGKSSGQGQRTIEAYASSILDWLEAVGILRAVFIGHSMGGAIAQTLALDYPDHVIGLGLIGSAARLRVNPVLIEKSARDETFSSAVEKVISWSFSANISENLKALVARRMAEIRPQVLSGDFMACDTYDRTRRIEEITCPTVVICGAEDRMTPVKNSRFLADHILTAQLSIVPEAGHMVMIEKPAEVATALVHFLTAIPY